MSQRRSTTPWPLRSALTLCSRVYEHRTISLRNRTPFRDISAAETDARNSGISRILDRSLVNCWCIRKQFEIIAAVNAELLSATANHLEVSQVTYLTSTPERNAVCSVCTILFLKRLKEGRNSALVRQFPSSTAKLYHLT